MESGTCCSRLILNVFNAYDPAAFCIDAFTVYHLASWFLLQSSRFDLCLLSWLRPLRFVGTLCIVRPTVCCW